MTMEEVKASSTGDQEFDGVDLSGALSSTDLSEDSNRPGDLTADKLLEELTLPEHQKTPNHIVASPLKRGNYDQFFEEVSLDLPRNNTTEDNLTKCTPHENNNSTLPPIANGNGSSNSESSNYRDEATSSDLSGPFYSISDVLEDTDIYSEPTSYNPRAARRNVNEAEVIVTAGGSSMPNKKRSSLSLFRQKSLNQKPSPLESVISKTRPRMLPPKNPQEEKRHLQEYEEMMKKAKKLELKKQKENDKKREQKDKRVQHALYVWEKDIIPNWKSKFNQTRTIVLWNQGIPARCRSKVWALRIGNVLNITKETFDECLPLHTKSSMDDSHGAPMPILSSKQKIYDKRTSLYSIGKHSKTSSLNVLQGKKENTENGFASSYSLNSTENEEACSGNASEGEGSSGGGNGDLGSIGSHVDEIGLEDDNGEDDSTSQEEEDVVVDNSILNDSAATDYLNKSIDEDILRTLPSLCVFQPDGPLFISLKKVLHAFLRYRSTTIYTRGTSFLAGILLLNMSPQNAFTSLVNLISRSQILSIMYSEDEKRIHGYFKIFNVVFAENLPKLYLHFKNLTLTPENYLPDWFMTIFASILPLEMSSRLWDLYLLHGDVIMFRTALTVLKYLEPLLWGGGFSETVKILNMGFVGEHRGEKVQAAFAVSGRLADGEEDTFFDEVLGRKGVYLDRARFKELLEAHMPKST